MSSEADEARVPMGFCSTSNSPQHPQVNAVPKYLTAGTKHGHQTRCDYLSHTSNAFYPAVSLEVSYDSEGEISVRDMQFIFLHAVHCLIFSSLCFFRLYRKTLKVILIALLFIKCFLGHTVPLTVD